MKVFGTGVDTQPKKGRIAFRGGDVVNPLDGDQLQQKDRPTVWPTRMQRWYCPLPILPWLCVCLPGEAGKRKGFYIGWKCYGFDVPDYLNWPGIEKGDVFEGSLALEPTIRVFTDG